MNKKAVVKIYDISEDALDDPIDTVRRVVRTIKCSDNRKKIAWHEVVWRRKRLRVVEHCDHWMGFVYRKTYIGHPRAEWTPVNPSFVEVRT